MRKFGFPIRWSTLGMVFIDILIVSLSYFLTYFFRFGGKIPEPEATFLRNSLPMVIMIKIYFLYDFSLYKVDLKYISINEIVNLFKAIVIASLTILCTVWLSGRISKLPRSVLIVDAVFCFMALGAIRSVPRVFEHGLHYRLRDYFVHFITLGRIKEAEAKRILTPVLIYGAGDAGEMLVRELKFSPNPHYEPVGFIDDDPEKQGRQIHGVSVLGGKNDLKKILEKQRVEQVIICIPSLRGKLLKDLLFKFDELGIKSKITPSLSEIVDERVRVSNIRDINVEDLLGREPVDLDIESISGYLRGKKILITGAGGSIGAELCRQVLKYDPAKLALFGRGEHSIFSIHNELKRKYPDRSFPQVIGDVINLTKVEKIFDFYRPDIVFHAGADKHVPLMEMNPDEAVLNNIVGTRNVILASDRFRVARLICVSTDKAVNPTSMMGACKRVAEKLIQSRTGGYTRVMGVRFGNVLGSRGSVIPLFESQIKAGGPVTVTHKDMVRFLMTIPEAAQLVIQAGAIGQNGELFVLDMGEQIKIDEFARTMIRLAGYKPDKEIDVAYTGIRPGEKMYEELIGSDEHREHTPYPKIIRITHSQKVEPGWLNDKIDALKQCAIDMDYEAIYGLLSEILPNYKTDQSNSEWALNKTG